MQSPHPGDYVLFRAISCCDPPWPAVVMADDDAPRHIQESRPQNVYRTLILLIRHSYAFRWAMTSEMSAYFPFQGTANDYLFRADDLAVAYEMTDFYIGARVGREFWREEVQTNFATLDLTAEGMAAKNEDASLALALQLSEEDLLEISDSDEEDNLDLYEAPSPPRRRSQQVPLRTAQQIILPFTKKADRGPGDKRKCNNDTTQTVKDSQLDRGNYRNPHKSRECSSSMDEQQIEVEDHVSLDESASGSDSEPEDADMGELEDFDMNGFVTVYGGDPPEAHSIPTRDLVDRAYFRSEMTGKCYFEFDKKSKQMRLTHPNLPELSSQHLGYVLEFLTQGTFTLLPPNEDNDPGTPFIQCGSAWEAAELLDMDDMIEHVADKLETEVKPWEMYDVLYFAGRLYDSDVTPYEATERLKAMLVKFIVDRYDEYQGSDELGNSFRNQLKSRRDLEEAIQAKRFGLVASQEASRDEDAER